MNNNNEKFIRITEKIKYGEYIDVLEMADDLKFLVDIITEIKTELALAKTCQITHFRALRYIWDLIYERM